MTQNMERLQALKSDKKFVNKAFWAYNWSIPMNFTRERMLGCSMVCMLARVADEIYPEDTVKQQELCRNHEVFFNTQQGLGAVIYGIVLGMEVERAHDDSITNELIQSIKQALAARFSARCSCLLPTRSSTGSCATRYLKQAIKPGSSVRKPWSART